MSEENKQLNGYDLSRSWFDFCFDNPEKIKPIHTAVYFFAIEHCNRLGWKAKFGFPTTMVMDAIGVKSYKTYISALKDIVEFGFIKMIQQSKNQYSANIIALVNFTEATTKALAKAVSKHALKQCQSTDQLTVSINKPINQEPINQETISSAELHPNLFEEESSKKKKYNPKKAVVDIEWISSDLWSEWIDHKKKVKASVTERAVNANIKRLKEFGEQYANKIIEKAMEKNWKDLYFDDELKNECGYNQSNQFSNDVGLVDHQKNRTGDVFIPFLDDPELNGSMKK